MSYIVDSNLVKKHAQSILQEQESWIQKLLDSLIAYDSEYISEYSLLPILVLESEQDIYDPHNTKSNFTILHFSWKLDISFNQEYNTRIKKISHQTKKISWKYAYAALEGKNNNQLDLNEHWVFGPLKEVCKTILSHISIPYVGDLSDKTIKDLILQNKDLLELTNVFDDVLKKCKVYYQINSSYSFQIACTEDICRKACRKIFEGPLNISSSLDFSDLEPLYNYLFNPDTVIKCSSSLRNTVLQMIVVYLNCIPVGTKFISYEKFERYITPLFKSVNAYIYVDSSGCVIETISHPIGPAIFIYSFVKESSQIMIKRTNTNAKIYKKANLVKELI